MLEVSFTLRHFLHITDLDSIVVVNLEVDSGEDPLSVSERTMMYDCYVGGLDQEARSVNSRNIDYVGKWVNQQATLKPNGSLGSSKATKNGISLNDEQELGPSIYSGVMLELFSGESIFPCCVVHSLISSARIC
ncbi:hypothetical protein GQR58_001584 [Nymphon striatum]|nr:hypothetical protein GQR58_001584 [Nymphon striatum]